MNTFGYLKEKTIGIVGGMGPDTTSEFYLKMIELARKYSTGYPSILIDNVSFPFYLEKEIILHSRNEEKILPFIKESILRLNKAGADFIVIPCNTVHIFIESFRNFSSVPVLSIVEESVKEIVSNNFKCVGILGTTKTIENGLYQKELEKREIKFILPSTNSQNKLSASIVKMLEGQKDYVIVKEVANELISQGCDSLLLACTDLQLVVSEIDFEVNVLDTMDILVKKSFETLKG